MPSLTPEDRAALLGPVVHPCPDCGRTPALVRHYCRSCDEFFLLCAFCGDPAVNPHIDHRIYFWTLEAIRAIPDFD